MSWLSIILTLGSGFEGTEKEFVPVSSLRFGNDLDATSLSRLKKVQGKKKRDAETSAVERKAAEAAGIAEDIEIGGGGGDLIDNKDEDVIF